MHVFAVQVAKTCDSLLRNFRNTMPKDFKVEVAAGGVRHSITFAVIGAAPAMMNFARAIFGMKSCTDVAPLSARVLPMLESYKPIWSLAGEMVEIKTWMQVIEEGLDVAMQHVKQSIQRTAAAQDEATKTLNDTGSLNLKAKLSAFFANADAFSDEHKVEVEKLLDDKASVSLYHTFRQIDAHRQNLETCTSELKKAKAIATHQTVLANIDALTAACDLAMGGEDCEANRANAGRTLGNLTALQAMYRDLRQGESRQHLAEKCRKGLKRKRYLSLDPHLAIHLDSVCDNVSDPAAQRIQNVPIGASQQ
jgi:hypothetical protein